MGASPFNPYHRWLGIPPKDQPADHYRLLGVERFECDPEVIRDAADRQMAHVRSYQLGEYSTLSQEVLNKLALARICLLNPQRKAAYDDRLRRQLAKGMAASAPLWATELTAPGSAFDGGGSSVLPGRTRLYPLRKRSRIAPQWLFLAGVAASLLFGMLMWRLTSGTRPRPDPVGDRVAMEDGAGRVTEPEPAPSPSPLPPPPPPPPPVDPVPETENEVPAGEDSGRDPHTIDSEVEADNASGPPEPADSHPIANPEADQQAPELRQPVPSILERGAILREVNEVYDTTAPRGPDEVRRLVGTLVDLADKIEDPARRFVLLRLASEMACGAGMLPHMLQLMTQIGDEFEVDCIIADQVSMLERFAEKATTQHQIRSLVVSSPVVIYQAIDAGRIDLADSLSATAYRACQSPAGYLYRKEALDIRREVQEMRDQWNQVEAARERLKSAPDDAEAHTIVGLWHAGRGEWDLAVPHLAEHSDPRVRALLRRDSNVSIEDTETVIELAGQWWELARSSNSASKPAWTERAAFWYETAWPHVANPLIREKIRKRLGEIGRPDPDLPPDCPGEQEFADWPGAPERVRPDHGRPHDLPRAQGVECTACNGEGVILRRCPNRSCARGTVRGYRIEIMGRNPLSGDTIYHRVPIRVPCPTCGGNFIRQERCPECRGSGKKP